MSYSLVFPPHPHAKGKKIRMKEKNKLEKNFSLCAPGALGGCKWLL